MEAATGTTATRYGTALIIFLDGTVTGAACPGIRDTVLRRLPEGVNHVLIDASDVTAIDDAVFSVLLAGGAWLRTRRGRIGFLAASASVRRSLASLGLSSLLPVLGRAAADALVANLTGTPSHALQSLQDIAVPGTAVPGTAVPGMAIPGQRKPADTPVMLGGRHPR